MAVAACKSRNDLNWLEQEKIRFKAENEEIRAKDLQAEFDKSKRRSDALNDDVLDLAQEREQLYADYDRLKGEIARMSRDREAKKIEFAAVAQELKDLRQKVGQLGAALEKERKLYDDLTRQLKDAEARRKALEAKKKGAKTPE